MLTATTIETEVLLLLLFFAHRAQQSVHDATLPFLRTLAKETQTPTKRERIIYVTAREKEEPTPRREACCSRRVREKHTTSLG